ncbi:MAG: hypothetical protein AAFQ89_25005 [Cyanobacteria bacterium J06626_18]
MYLCFWLIANWRELPYFDILGEAPEDLNFHNILCPVAHAKDTWVDPKQVLEILERADVAPM